MDAQQNLIFSSCPWNNAHLHHSDAVQVLPPECLFIDTASLQTSIVHIGKCRSLMYCDKYTMILTRWADAGPQCT